MRRRAAVGALLLGAAAIGLAPNLVRLSEAGSTATAFWRVTLALPLLWVWRSLDRRNRTRSTRVDHRWPTWDWRLLLPGLFFAGDLALWHVSIFWTSVANATLLANLSTIFVSLIAWPWLGERFRWQFPIGMILALAGAAMIMRVSLELGTHRLLGDCLGVASALFYAGYQLSIKRLRSTHSTGAIMFWSGLASALTLLVLSLCLGERMLPVSGYGWMALLGLAVVVHVGGQGLIAWALAHASVSFGSVSLLLQPVVAALVAWKLFQETLSGAQFAGGAVVLLGIYLAWQGSRQVKGNR
jgi:drug/metabolite transporter (DMT)-like permease